MKYLFALLFILPAGCTHTGKEQAAKKVEIVVAIDSAKTDLRNLSFAVKKDLSCGMPVSAGVEDTVTYKGKLYGFCSKECKEEFLKNPKEYLIAK